MESQDNMLSFMDMLDLDEELIDERLKAIMDRSNHTVKHLSSALHLLQYKQLVNIKENSDCENDAECDFAAKVIGNVSEENINYVCDIVRITLSLSSETLVIKAEHLLQQIMSDLIVPHDSKDTSEGSENVAVLKLKISDSILEAVIKRNVKLNLPFLELPVSGILKGSDEKLKIHFLTTTVPKLFEGVCGFNILDKIWQFVKEIKNRNAGLVLLILSSLSEYFLPVPDTTGTISFVSKIVYEYEFWNNVLRGLSSDEASLRKMSIYLAKRAVDCVYSLNKNVSVKHENLTLFRWNYVDKINLKQLWDNYFTLVDSLEEKQSNIVLPSLQLFGSLRLLDCWLVCAFKLGLRHDNTQVRMKCIQHRLNVILKSEPEAKALLEALNDINLYENQTECDELKKRMKAYLSDENIFTCVFTSMPTIKWSPVPLYHISTILAEINFAEFVTTMPDEQVPKYIIDILSVSCNNVAVREAVYVNISHFLGNCCLNLSWQHLLGICIMHPNIFCNTSSYNPLKSLFTRKFIKNVKEKKVFFQMLFETHLYVDFALLYLEYHGTDVQTFLEVLLDKTTKIDDITNKENSDVSECLQDVIYLAKLFNKTKNTRLTMFKTINEIVLLSYKTILNYILRLILNKTVLSFNEIIVLSDAFHSMSISINNAQLKEPMLRLYKEFILIIKDKNSVLETKVLTIYMIHSLTMNPVLKENYQLELLTLNDVIILTEAFEKTPSIGRLKNLFYEKSCAIVDYILKEDDSNKVEHIVRITAYIENVVECGGYGCLKFCLNIMNTILGDVLENPNINYDLTKFIDKMWNEIEELRTNSQYNPCIEEFIKLITNESLLRTPKYNNTIELYCMKIVNFGTIKTSPLFYLVKRLNNITISLEHGLIIYVLSEVLLYAPVPRKDQRILDNLAISVLNDPKYNFVNEPLDIRFNFQIQYLSIPMLMKLTEQDIIESIDIFIRNRINEVFANKLRYHGHSQAHRTLLTGLQHLLMIFTLKCGNCGDTLNWCIDLLGKLPHQPSVRTCLEWYIALHAFIENNSLNEELAKRIEKLPTVSQFLILFWIAKRKILDNTCSEKEFDFVMDHLLSHTMGQMFNIRLHAQYLASKLHSLHDLKSSKYEYTINVIEKTFVESAKDKNFVKLKNDYFVNNFDIITNLTPCFIYYFLPRYCEINNNEAIDLTFVKDVMKDVSSTIANLEFYKKYTGQINDEDVFNLDICKESNGNADDDIEASGTIQKKYVPWRNMSDVNVYGAGKKKESTSELVVVASLIDKLPNLGGMARTSEVFGVKTYVVDSLRHLQDKQFQGLSVSAERWIDVKEVRPGSALKQYLLQMKAEGYSIVAAEQTSNSVKLQSFKFPKKTLLLLGHEKEGIPCDLLPLMDFCVEIPQQGFIRSLNVHVTAAIFVWEYTRQNIL